MLRTITRRTTALSLAATLAIVSSQGVLAQTDISFDEQAALLDNESNTIDVIERYGPSVVAVAVSVRNDDATEAGPDQADQDGIDDDDQLDPDDFRRFFGPDGPVQRSSGSGFLIEFEAQPFLITNFHVVEGALDPETADFRDGADISVTFPEDADAAIPVEVIGVNPSFDLALLRLLDADDLPTAEPLTIADSDGLRVGQKTVAIGNPFGLASSVTSGIVSAVGRFVPTIGQLPVPMIQTDAAINPGNSGGPLLDSRGQLIGINTALINPQGRSFAGLGFAVPSNLLIESLANLELGGVTDVSDTRPRLGIAAQSLSLIPPGLRVELGLPDEGIAVIDVQSGSVAERAGILGTDETITFADDFEIPTPGDIIVAIDGQAVDSVEDLSMIVTYDSMAGDELLFTIVRDGDELDVAIVLEVGGSIELVAPAG